MTRPTRRSVVAASTLGLGAAILPRRARAAEIAEVAIARGFAIPHLPVMVMEREKLYEKHLAAAGLPGTTVSWSTIGSGVVMNAALLSGTLHVATGGAPPMITLWAKTRSTPLEVRGICAEATMPNFLNTRNPAVRTIRDFGPQDRIGVGAIKTSIQAILLQMACAKAFGQAEYARLDELTIGLSSVDATTAIRTAGNPVNSNFSIPPFQYEELRVPGIHRVFSSYEVTGGPHTFSIAWTTSRFRSENPATYRAFLAAIREATDIIRNERERAAKLYIDLVKAKSPVQEVVALLDDPEIEFTLTPRATTRLADFMEATGTIKGTPAAWTDIFFPEVHDLKGS